MKMEQPMAERPAQIVVDCTTGEQSEVEMTDTEEARHLASKDEAAKREAIRLDHAQRLEEARPGPGIVEKIRAGQELSNPELQQMVRYLSLSLGA